MEQLFGKCLHALTSKIGGQAIIAFAITLVDRDIKVRTFLTCKPLRI